jgi:hypothetical protein
VQRMEDGVARASSSSLQYPVADVDEDIGYSAWGIQWWCLVASWCVGESVGERREGGEDDSDEAQRCPGASRDVPVHALAHLGVVTMSWPGRFLLLLDSK